MSGKRHSMAYITVSGVGLLATLPGAKLDLGGTERTPVVGDHTILGFSEKLKPAMLECEISLGQGMSLAALQAMTGATVTYEADSGQTYMVRDAFTTDTLSVSSGEGGKVALKMQGQPAQELLA